MKSYSFILWSVSTKITSLKSNKTNNFSISWTNSFKTWKDKIKIYKPSVEMPNRRANNSKLNSTPKVKKRKRLVTLLALKLRNLNNLRTDIITHKFNWKRYLNCKTFANIFMYFFLYLETKLTSLKRLLSTIKKVQRSWRDIKQIKIN